MRHSSRLLLLSLLLLLSSCLEFDAQEITFRHDPVLDRIDALIVYRGLFVEAGSGSGDQPIEKALKDLDGVKARGDLLFWNNWPLRVDPTVADGPGIALLPHLQIENGGLFTDPKGVLCAYQFVRITKAKAFLQKVNLLLEVAVQDAMAREHKQGDKTHKFSADSRDALREFLHGRKLLVVERGRIELRLPCDDSDHRWLKSQIETGLLGGLPDEITRRRGVEQLRAAGGSVTETAIQRANVEIPGDELKAGLQQAPTFRLFWDNDFTFDRRAGITTFGLGEPDVDELRLVKAPDGLYHDAFLKALRERGDKIEDGLPDPELARRFEAFRGRDCVLPEQFAATRKGKTDPKDGDQ